MTLPSGEEVDVASLGRVDDDELRVEIDGPEGKWQLLVTADGDYDLEASWDGDGNMADVALPEYLPEALELIGTRV